MAGCIGLFVLAALMYQISTSAAMIIMIGAMFLPPVAVLMANSRRQR